MEGIVLKIDDLIIMQNGLRKPEQINQMIEFVKDGGFFSGIEISRFPDNQDYIHDGHHRVVSIYLAGRDYLGDGEYIVGQWRYEQYMTPNYTLQFLSPFDPKTEVRIHDFSEYQDELKHLIQTKALHFAEEIDNFIRKNSHRYKIERPHKHISYLSNILKKDAI